MEWANGLAFAFSGGVAVYFAVAGEEIWAGLNTFAAIINLLLFWGLK